MSSIVILWCHVRSLSTAFERAFMQRQDYITLHEPFTEPFCFGPERFWKLYDEEKHAQHPHAKTTFFHITEQILDAASGEKKVFVKDMVYCVLRDDYQSHPENPTVLPLEFLKRCKHTFLIRTPKKAVPSGYRIQMDDRCGGTFAFDHMAYWRNQVLFDFLTKLTGAPPPLVDADDLIQEPVALMAKYCEAIQDRFDPCMLKWQAGKIDAFSKWVGYHDDAERSTGFKEIERKDDEENLPDIVQETIKDNMSAYEALRQFRI